MSTTSINKNNLAKEEIKKALTNYAYASNHISVGNNNSKTKEIQDLIFKNMDNLNEAKLEIESINNIISNKLRELKKKEEQGE